MTASLARPQSRLESSSGSQRWGSEGAREREACQHRVRVGSESKENGYRFASLARVAAAENIPHGFDGFLPMRLFFFFSAGPDYHAVCVGCLLVTVLCRERGEDSKV